MIFPVWQLLGQSSHILAKECGEALGHKATHTGTLDPMAEGVVVILTDEDRFAKGSLTDWQKVYEFSILWGVETDSGDKLGIVKKISDDDVTVEEVVEKINKFPLVYDQKLSAFSSRRFNGKSAFDWAKNGEELPVKKRSVVLENFLTLESRTLRSVEVLHKHEQAVSLINGDFRQQEIVQSWQEVIGKKSQNFLITRHQVTTSPGTYIRQLVQDIASKVNIPATTWSITRIKNGPYEKVDCVETGELEASLN